MMLCLGFLLHCLFPLKALDFVLCRKQQIGVCWQKLHQKRTPGSWKTPSNEERMIKTKQNGFFLCLSLWKRNGAEFQHSGASFENQGFSRHVTNPETDLQHFRNAGGSNFKDLPWFGDKSNNFHQMVPTRSNGQNQDKLFACLSEFSMLWKWQNTCGFKIKTFFMRRWPQIGHIKNSAFVRVVLFGYFELNC